MLASIVFLKNLKIIWTSKSFFNFKINILKKEIEKGAMGKICRY